MQNTRSSGLYPIKLVKNPSYIKNGLKAVGELIRKYEIIPTLATPFTTVHELVDESQSLLSKRLHLGTHKHDNNNNSYTVARMRSKDSSTGKLGEVPAQDIQNDSEYLAQVQIGSPAQTMNLDFDTGSSDLWVWAGTLKEDVRKRGEQSSHNIFFARKSSTWKHLEGQKWQIQYGDGSTARGIVGTDTLNLGGLRIENQAVELAQELSESFQSSAGDGLLGLAFGQLNTVRPTRVQTPVENMTNQSDINRDSELFTAYLTNHSDNIPPCYTFGYIDQKLVNGGTIHYAPVDTSQGFWQIQSTSVCVNGAHFPLTGNTAIMDTGTTLAMIDDNTCKSIYAAIPGSKYDASQGGYLFPSSTPRSQLPVLTFAIGGHDIVIDKDDIGFADAGDGWTFGGFQSRGNMTFSIYGGSVLKSMYAIFDQGRKQFGFVQKADVQGSP